MDQNTTLSKQTSTTGGLVTTHQCPLVTSHGTDYCKLSGQHSKKKNWSNCFSDFWGGHRPAFTLKVHLRKFETCKLSIKNSVETYPSHPCQTCCSRVIYLHMAVCIGIHWSTQGAFNCKVVFVVRYISHISNDHFSSCVSTRACFLFVNTDLCFSPTRCQFHHSPATLPLWPSRWTRGPSRGSNWRGWLSTRHSIPTHPRVTCTPLTNSTFSEKLSVSAVPYIRIHPFVGSLLFDVVLKKKIGSREQLAMIC